MFMAANEFPLPYEYRFISLDGLVTAPPADLDERTIVFLDCGNIDRNPADVLQRRGAHILNIDHHHDNTRFGTVNHVVPEASCTAEIVWDLMHGLGVEPTPTIAEALYVGLVTDTGQFMYENTGTRAHVMAAELIEAGVDVHDDLPAPLRGRPVRQARAAGARAGQRRALRRRPPHAHHAHRAGLPRGGRRGELLRGRRRPPARGRGHGGRGARARPLSSGGHERPAQGLAARHRRPRRRLGDRPRPGRRRPPPGRRLLHRALPRGARRVPARAGRRAALTWPNTGATPSRRHPLSTSPPGSPRTTSWRACGRGSGEGVKVGHAGTLDPFATGLLLVLVGRGHARAALPDGAAEALRDGGAARRPSRTPATREGEIVETGGVPEGELALPTGRAAPAPAGLLGGQGRRRARLRAGPPRRGRSSSPSARSSVDRFERAVARRRPRARSRSNARRAPTCAR